jgi:hypothetical protein
MYDEIENRSLRRRVLLMVMASAFLVWQVPAMDFFDGIAGVDNTAIRFVTLGGFLVWAAALVFLFAFGRVARRDAGPEITAALEDELVRSNRSKAFTVGYAASLATSAAVFSASLFWPITGSDAAHLVLVSAVVAPMYAFAVLERVNA